ncbi:MAG TPA: hypothetical protein VK807_08865 [Gemmatimonadaceae bacterium]|nr:hypothetical protein [Gemmatimonadaceae bacterium]
MRDLLPFSAYESASTVSFGRSTLVLGLLWGIPMTTFMLRTHQGSLGFVLVIGAIGALIFGSLITMLARFARRQLTQAVYYCVWPIVPAAPPGEYEARLMCSLIRGRLPVGGHLYVGPRAWTFVPHARNGPVMRKTVRWEQPSRLSVSAQRPSWGWLAWLFGVPTDDQVVLADGEAQAVLVVPNAADVVPELTAAISVKGAR